MALCDPGNLSNSLSPPETLPGLAPAIPGHSLPLAHSILQTTQSPLDPSTHLRKGCGPAFSAFSLGDVPCPLVTLMVTCATCLPTTHTRGQDPAGRLSPAVSPVPCTLAMVRWALSQGVFVTNNKGPATVSLHVFWDWLVTALQRGKVCHAQDRDEDTGIQKESRARPRHIALRNEPETHT